MYAKEILIIGTLSLLAAGGFLGWVYFSMQTPAPTASQTNTKADSRNTVDEYSDLSDDGGEVDETSDVRKSESNSNNPTVQDAEDPSGAPSTTHTPPQTSNTRETSEAQLELHGAAATGNVARGETIQYALPDAHDEIIYETTTTNTGTQRKLRSNITSYSYLVQSNGVRSPIGSCSPPCVVGSLDVLSYVAPEDVCTPNDEPLVSLFTQMGIPTDAVTIQNSEACNPNATERNKVLPNLASGTYHIELELIDDSGTTVATAVSPTFAVTDQSVSTTEEYDSSENTGEENRY